MQCVRRQDREDRTNHMTRFLNLSIRIQLMVLAVLLTLPALGIIVYSGFNKRAEDYHSAVIESQKLADSLADQQEDLVREARLLGMLLAGLPDVKNRNVDKVQPVLASIHRGSPQYVNILIADADGTIWASAMPVREPYSLADRRYFKDARSSRRFSAGEFVVSKTSKRPTIHMAYPLLDHDEFRGVVVVGFDLDIMRSTLERAQLPADANYIFTDHKGLIISRGKDPDILIGKPIPPDALKKMEDGPDRETYLFVRRDGSERITTYRKLWLPGEDRPYMYVRAGISRQESLAKANRALLLNISTLLLFVVVAFVVAIVIGKRSIVDRITLLKRASQRLADGDLDFKVSEQVSGGELGSLGQTFDDMAHQLAVRLQALRESESNYRDIFNATNDAMFVHDAETGAILEVNRTAEKMFGYTREELLQRSVQDLSSGEAPHSLPEALERILKSGTEGPQEFEWLCKRKSAELFWADIALLATSIAGKPRVLAILRDITERKEMDRMKDEMLSAVSHEMRTPLTAMLGFLQFVLENQVDEAQMRDYLVIMHKEAERLNELISNFLDMQRLKIKQKFYTFAPLAVAPLLEEAAALFTVSSTDHVIRLHVPVGLPQVYGDEVLLHQVLANLISNAVKYSPKGSVIDLGARRDEDYVTLWVRDQGIGIPPESLDKVFDMFYRVDNTSKRQTAGTGLGLALVKEIVAAHGGQVWVDSVAGKGSTFHVSLPAITARMN